MNTDEILRLVPCCTCGASLGKTLNVVGTGRRAQWLYPVMGNVITGKMGEAVAFLCDKCVEKNAPPLAAVEFSDSGVFRHPLDTLTPL